MEVGHFYYIDDRYFTDFPDEYLMKNKEKVDGHVHDRPCFYTFQNMCPITLEYMKNEYYDSNANVPVRVNGVFEKELKEKASRVLALQRKGIKLIFPDIFTIEKALIEKMNKEKEQNQAPSEE